MEIDGDLARFPNGLVLRLDPGMVSAAAIYDACAEIADPPIPHVWVAELGRHEENADDPDYKAALAAAEERRSEAAIEVLLILGTDLEEPPPGTKPPSDFPWAKLAAVRHHIPPEPERRYALWLRMYGVGTDAAALGEYLALLNHLLRASGIAQEEVLRAVGSFRNRAGRRADNAGGVAPPAANRNGRPRIAAHRAQP